MDLRELTLTDADTVRPNVTERPALVKSQDVV
jgi:hypothetical protein